MRRPAIFAMLAAVAAVLAAVVVFSALQRREAEVQNALTHSVEIVVAARELPLGAKLDQTSMKLTRWSRDSVPEGAFTDTKRLMNAYVTSRFVANEPIVASKLFVGDRAAGVMPLLIPPGMRAMSVAVDEVSDIAGFVLPQTRVDVLAAISGGGPEQPAFSRIVLQNVEVIAVAQEIEGSKDEPVSVKVVTLLVSPQDSEKLALASREGSLRLAMRNYSDSKFVITAGADMHDLLYPGVREPSIRNQPVAEPPGAPPRRPAMSVEILRDGRSAGSISFINTALPGHQRRLEPAIDAPAPMTSSEGAAAPAGPKRDAKEAAALSAAMPAPVAIPEGPAVVEKPNSADTNHTPVPKSIDIP